jgi:hypothetical protein
LFLRAGLLLAAFRHNHATAMYCTAAEQIGRCPLWVKSGHAEKLVHSHHHAGRLDDGVSRFAFFELEFVHGLIGDRGGDGLTADVNPNMGCGGALSSHR